MRRKGGNERGRAKRGCAGEKIEDERGEKQVAWAGPKKGVEFGLLGLGENQKESYLGGLHIGREEKRKGFGVSFGIFVCNLKHTSNQNQTAA